MGDIDPDQSFESRQKNGLDLEPDVAHSWTLIPIQSILHHFFFFGAVGEFSVGGFPKKRLQRDTL